MIPESRVFFPRMADRRSVLHARRAVISAVSNSPGSAIWLGPPRLGCRLRGSRRPSRQLAESSSSASGGPSTQLAGWRGVFPWLRPPASRACRGPYRCVVTRGCRPCSCSASGPEWCSTRFVHRNPRNTGVTLLNHCVRGRPVLAAPAQLAPPALILRTLVGSKLREGPDQAQYRT